MKVNEAANGIEGVQSPVAKFLSDAIVREILARTGAADGDIIFFGADSKKVVCDAMGALRLKVGRSGPAGEQLEAAVGHRLPDVRRRWRRRSGCHAPPVHRAERPEPGAAESQPGRRYANAYDMVINGYEVGGGSVRIHNSEMQATVFDILGLPRPSSA